MMRILLVVGAYPPSDKHGGPAVTNHCLAKALKSMGHNVFVLTTDVNGTERLDVPNCDTEWDGIAVRYCHWINCFLPYHSPQLGRELEKRASSFDIALISSSWTMYGLYAGRTCRKINLPYIMYSHGSYDPARLRRGRLKKKLFWWFFDSHLYNRASAVVALTKGEKTQMYNMGIRVPIAIIPNGVEAENLEQANRCQELNLRWPQLCERPYILFLGRLEQIKGIDLLIYAFERIHKDFPDHLLVLAGPGERGWDRRMVHLAHRLKLADSVLFTGIVQGVLKNALLQNSQVFVLTSYGEGLPMSVLEAMSASTPVLITHECNIPEVHEVNAGLVVKSDVASVVSGLSTLLSNKHLRQEMGANGRQLIVERFNWKRAAIETIDLCRSILASRNLNGHD